MLLDYIEQDRSDLASMPSGSHIGQLGTLFISEELPTQFLMRYDYDFLYHMKCGLLQLRWKVNHGISMVAHSIMEELIIYLCNKEGRNIKRKWRRLMFEQMKWEETYELWKMGCYHFPKVLTDPVSVETIFVEYEQDGYIYGYDWLETVEAQERAQLIQKNPLQFLYFTKSTNKGTIQTAEMLMEACNEEELAAIWIAATAKELYEYRMGSNVGRYANMLHSVACEFLRARYFLWHHAMKRLVPEIMIPSSVLENIACKDAEPVIGLIQMNTVLLKSTWSILRYSSLKDGKLIESSCRISPE